MRAIHPFPARMAPDTIHALIEGLPADAIVLDPMCGSGVVIRQAAEIGLRGIGYDVDPLAVLMSQVWTCDQSVSGAQASALAVINEAGSLRLPDVWLPSIDECQETEEFVEYWFALPQRRDLRKISFLLTFGCPNVPKYLRDLLWLALSRIIITKQVGASLAWDASHSRPHKMREDNDFDVKKMFVRSAAWLAEVLRECPIKRPGRVKTGDCRNLSSIRSKSVHAVITII